MSRIFVCVFLENKCLSTFRIWLVEVRMLYWVISFYHNLGVLHWAWCIQELSICMFMVIFRTMQGFCNSVKNVSTCASMINKRVSVKNVSWRGVARHRSVARIQTPLTAVVLNWGEAAWARGTAEIVLLKRHGIYFASGEECGERMSASNYETEDSVVVQLFSFRLCRYAKISALHSRMKATWVIALVYRAMAVVVG